MADSILSDEKIDELEAIDKLTLPEALRLCIKEKIDVGDTKELHTLTWLIKYHLKCFDKRRSKAVSFFASNAHDDRARKEALAALYDDITEYTKQTTNQDTSFAEELDTLFPSICKTLAAQKENIKSAMAPILILGETGSGKSSFINLLLGEDFLPCSILSNTHVICEIRYCGDGNKSSAKLHKAGKEVSELVQLKEEDERSAFTSELEKHLQELDQNGKAVYKLAEIYLPCIILKSGLMIVDSPGIGESEDMDSMVLDYILNACAFIYIIDSTNAGGIQMRVKELIQKVVKKSSDEQKLYRPDSALFICNKWDGVSLRDRHEVWDDTKKKIQDAWINCKESQIIRFSTTEALFIQEKGAISPAFETVLQNISQLLPISQEVQILKGYTYLERFVSRCVLYFGANLARIDLSHEQRETQQRETSVRLNQVNAKITDFFDQQTKIIEREVDAIANELKKFIQRKSNTDKVCKFSDSELPIKQTWDDFKVEIRSTVYIRLRKVIKEWEDGESTLSGIAEEIEQTLEKEFPAISKEIYDAEQMMTHSESCHVSDRDLNEDEVTFVPEIVGKAFSWFRTEAGKIAFGIGLSPIFLLGAIGRLPVFGILKLAQVITRSSNEKAFRKAQNDKEKLKEIAESYADEIVSRVTNKMDLRQVIFEDIQPLSNFLKQQKKLIEDQIKSDINILKSMQDEEREDEDIRKSYTPKKAQYQLLQQRLEHFLLTYMPGIPVTAIEVNDIKICDGISASVFSAKSKAPSLTETNTAVCVRFANEKITADNVDRFRDVQIAYTTFRQNNIAVCYGLWNQEIGSDRLGQVFEPLRSSLREHLTAADFISNRDSNCGRTMTEIVSALDYLHNRKFVHFDLSVDTVAVDFFGRVKLTNICLEMPVNLKPEITDGKVCISNYIHLPPKFFLNHNNPKYQARHDMYSVGMMMWEMWTGQGVVERGKLYDIDEVFQEEKDTSVTWKSSEKATPTSRVTTKDSMDSSKNAAGSRQQSRSLFITNALIDSLENDDDVSKSSEEQTTTDSDETRGSSSYDFSEDPELFRHLMVAFRPKYVEMHFEFKDNEKKHALGQQWWKTVQDCLDEKCRAEDWLNRWSEHPVAQD